MTVLDDRIKELIEEELTLAPPALSAHEIAQRQWDMPVASTPGRRHRSVLAILGAAAVAIVVVAGVALGGRSDRESPVPDATVVRDAAVNPAESRPPDTTIAAGPAAPPTPPDAGAATPVGRLAIPRIDVDSAVVSGDRDQELATATLLHYRDTPLPEEDGTTASIVFGNRTTYGHEFSDLDELQPGDQLVWTSESTSVPFVVTGSAVTGWDDPIDAPAGTALVLTTPHPRYSTSQRLNVYAVRAAPAAPTTSDRDSLSQPLTLGSAGGAVRRSSSASPSSASIPASSTDSSTGRPSERCGRSRNSSPVCRPTR